MIESQIQDAIRKELGDVRRYPEVVLWPNVCGVFVDERGIKRRVGLANPGGADLIGMWTMADGRALFIALEIKSATGRQRDGQRQFEELVTRRGGVYAVLRSVEDAQQWAEQMRSKQ